MSLEVGRGGGGTSPPPSCVPEPGDVPIELREVPQWVCWRYVWKDTKWTKVPIVAMTGRAASATDPKGWATFDEAMELAGRDTSLAGVGFVFAEEDGFAGVDLDGCIDDAGAIADSAREVIAGLGSYTEVSPSGQGVKVFLRGTKPSDAACRSKAIKGYKETEVYDRGRFFTVTGQHLLGTPTEVMERQDELESLCDRLWPLKQSTPSRPRGGGAEGFSGDDETLIEKAKRATNGVRFSALWGGDTTHHGGDDSSADMALCSMLAFWTGRDADRMDRLFRQSGLVREKWDEQHGSKTYGQLTIGKAINFCSHVYEGGRGRQSLTGEASADHKKLLSDIGNAARLADQGFMRIGYNYQMGRWFVWCGTRWKPDDSGEVVKLAKAVALGILGEAKEAGDLTAQGLIEKWARNSQKRDRLTAMIELARPELAIDHESLDSDSWLLNCLNGTIDLRTGLLRPHDPSDLITKLVPVENDPDATCPLFDKVLRQALPSAAVRRYFMAIQGYCLTGVIRDQILAIYHGRGANGKSTLLDTICSIMGDYAGEAPPELLVVRKHAEHPTEIADLMGKRLVVASETEQESELRIQLVKRLTGNMYLKGRFMRGDYFQFLRTHKTVLLTNNRMRIPDDSDGAWRRVKVVPFDVQVPEAKQDTRMLEKLRAEWPGILAALVRGNVDWQEHGLIEPEEVTAASLSWRVRRNTIQEFVSERCRRGGGLVCVTSELIEAYTEWCEKRNLTPLQAKSLAVMLKREGFTPKKVRSQRHWCGLELDRRVSGQKGHNGHENDVPF